MQAGGRKRYSYVKLAFVFIIVRTVRPDYLDFSEPKLKPHSNKALVLVIRKAPVRFLVALLFNAKYVNI